MAYLGVSPSNGVRQKHTYTATASQTSFSGAGAENITLSYKDSNYVDVYQNGVKLSEADYTATTGTTVVLATGATVSDMIEIVVYDVFSVADTVSKADGGQFDGNVTMAGTITVTGNADLNGDLDVDGSTNLDVVDIDGAVDMASTLDVAGVVTANAGIKVDNITIDGTEIVISSGDITLDSAGQISLDYGSGAIIVKAGGTEIGKLHNSSTDFVIESVTSDEDILFKGNDGGSGITALTLDMSAAGAATFNNSINAPEYIKSTVGKSHIGEFTGNATTAANAVSIIRLEGCFTSDYSVYRLIGELGGDQSAEDVGKLRFLTSGTTSHDSGYYWGNLGVDDAGNRQLAADANTAEFQWSKNLASTVSVHVDMHIYFGGINSRIGILGRATYHDQGSDRGFMDFGGVSEGITSATGIEFFCMDGGNIAGYNFSVYGYRTQQGATGKMVGSYS